MSRPRFLRGLFSSPLAGLDSALVALQEAVRPVGNAYGSFAIQPAPVRIVADRHLPGRHGTPRCSR